jgi:hypothetical protein
MRYQVEEVQFVKELPSKRSSDPNSWANRLLPLVNNPGQWALVGVADNPRMANKLQSNLARRQLIIPFPDHTWEFAARWCEVYGIYRGKKRSGSGSVR